MITATQWTTLLPTMHRKKYWLEQLLCWNKVVTSSTIHPNRFYRVIKRNAFCNQGGRMHLFQYTKLTPLEQLLWQKSYLKDHGNEEWLTIWSSTGGTSLVFLREEEIGKLKLSEGKSHQCNKEVLGRTGSVRLLHSNHCSWNSSDKCLKILWRNMEYVCKKSPPLTELAVTELNAKMQTELSW